MSKTKQIILIAICIPFLTGCWIYTFDPKGKLEIGSIAVEQFENKTGEFGFADRLADVVIDELIADGNLKIFSPENADAILRGVLTRYERVVQVFDENDRVDQFKIRLHFEISLINQADQSEIWKEQMTPEGIYSAVNETEEDGQQRAAEALVEAIINRTTQSW